ARRPLVAACPLAPAGGLSFRAVDELTTTTGIAALAAGALALIALLWVVELDRDFRSLHSYVEDLASGLQTRLTTVEQRLDGAVTHHGLIRYDAYNEM